MNSSCWKKIEAGSGKFSKLIVPNLILIMPYKLDFINGITVRLPKILQQLNIASLRKRHGHVIQEVVLWRNDKDPVQPGNDTFFFTKGVWDLAGVRLPYKAEIPKEILYKRIVIERRKELEYIPGRDTLDYELNGLVT
jgi:hypothetical protein